MSKYILNKSDTKRVVIEYFDNDAGISGFVVELQEKRKFFLFGFWTTYFRKHASLVCDDPDLDKMSNDVLEAYQRRVDCGNKIKSSGWIKE